MRSTDRLICILESVNADAVNNDGGAPGEFLAEVCREAARRLRELEIVHQERMEQVGEFLAARGYSNGDILVSDEDDDGIPTGNNHGC